MKRFVGGIPSPVAKLMRVGEVETRQSHKLKIGGANPSPATKLCRDSTEKVQLSIDERPVV